MNNVKNYFFLFLLIAFSSTAFSQEKSEKVSTPASSDFSYDLLQKSFAKNDRISIANKNEFLKELEKTNFINGTIYFSGPGFPQVKVFQFAGNLKAVSSEFDKMVSGSNIHLDKCTIKNNDGTIIKDFKKSILFY